MEEFLKEMEKMIKAGIGAVATGVEKAQGAVDKLAQKGEPLYRQAKVSVSEFADKVAKTFAEIGKPKLADMIHDAQSLCDEELTALNKALEEMIRMRAEEAAAAAVPETNDAAPEPVENQTPSEE